MNDFDDFGGCLADEEFFKEEQFYEKQRRKEEAENAYNRRVDNGN